MKSLFVLLICTLSVAANATVAKPAAVGDIGDMTRTQYGDFQVTCADGSTETVTQLDLQLENVCPKLESVRMSRIKSAQKRADGFFDVTCVDGSSIVANSSQIREGNLCPFNGVIEDGRYKAIAGQTAYYDQNLEVIYTNGVLSGLHIKLENGYHAELICVDTSCKGKGSNGDDDEIRLIDSSHYEFYASGVGAWATFEKQ